jgi:tRNA-specific 2-thiouridylase
MAGRLGLRVADKPDSQEICFVTRGRYDEFVRRRRAIVGDGSDTSGELVTTAGEVVARHIGIEGFTVGQRQGLGVALGDRKFVVRIEPEERRVVIGDRAELYRRELTARDANWFCAPPYANKGANQGDILLFGKDTVPHPAESTEKVECPLFVSRCHAQIRYNAAARPAALTHLRDGRFHIEFDEPQFAVTPGQAVVIYDAQENNRVLGGGWIE